MRDAAPLAVYPGTFDPVTNGHLDVIERGARLFERLVVAAAVNTGKAPLFTEAERVAMLRVEVARFPNVEVDAFRGLAVEYARRRGARVILRGIRTLSDFEYEFQMALTNRTLAPDIETIFVMSNVEWSYTSSRLLKEAALMGADVSHFLPPRVNEAVRKKLCTK
jgi:pantetheine-phosphate adenylyltransferase